MTSVCRETMHGMDAAALEELRALRARAYGPHADIELDPAAVQRLRELEAQSSGSTTRSPVAAATDVTSTLPPEPELEPQPEPGPEPAPEPESPARTDPGTTGSLPAPAAADAATATDEPETAERPRAEPDRTRRLSRRVGLMWGLSVVASAALAAGITYAATSMAPVSVSSGASQIATLEPSPLIEIPAGWFGAGPSARAFEFYGLTLFETAHGYIGTGSDCFMAIPTEQLPAEDADPNNWSMNGPLHSGCRVGDFPATVEVPVDSGMPEELRDRFPPGSALQFVLDGDRMGVFLDSP